MSLPIASEVANDRGDRNDSGDYMRTSHNRARKNKHTARKDHSIPLRVCIPVLDGGKEARDETLRTSAWEARFAQTVNCFYGPYPFVYIGQPTSKGSNPLLLLSGILIYV